MVSGKASGASTSVCDVDELIGDELLNTTSIDKAASDVQTESSIVGGI